MSPRSIFLLLVVSLVGGVIAALLLTTGAPDERPTVRTARGAEAANEEELVRLPFLDVPGDLPLLGRDEPPTRGRGEPEARGRGLGPAGSPSPENSPETARLAWLRSTEASSRALPGRASGSLARQASTIRSSSASISGPRPASRGGGSWPMR